MNPETETQPEGLPMTPVWTTAKPDKPGWYWWKFSNGAWRIVLIEPGMYVRVGYNILMIYECDGQWSGPIQPPEEK
jgi:hypothetical protein